MLKRSLSRAALAAVVICAQAALAQTPTPAASPQTPAPAPMGERLKGYLSPSELPDSVALLPPPPPVGSVAFMLDEDTAEFAIGLAGSPRFQQAALDAILAFPFAASTFSCAIGVAIKPDTTPTLYRLLQRTLSDAGAATGKAKDLYRHARPFMVDNHPTCRPEDDDALRKNGSYPSGHTSAGWAWGEVLAEIAPDRANAILARARAFGESRIVCNVHWASDVMEGRLIGAATVVDLHANAEFRDDLAKAKTELDAARAAGDPPQRDCAAEASALQQTPWLTQ